MQSEKFHLAGFWSLGIFGPKTYFAQKMLRGKEVLVIKFSLAPKIFGPKWFLVHKKSLIKNNFCSIKNTVRKILGLHNNESKEILGVKIFGSKKILVQKNRVKKWGPSNKNLGSKKYFDCKKKFGSKQKKIGPKKLRLSEHLAQKICWNILFSLALALSY